MIEAAILVYLFVALGALPILRVDPPGGGVPAMLVIAFAWPLLLAIALLVVMANGFKEFL